MQPLLGILFALLAATAFGVSNVFARVGTQRVDVTLSTLISLIAGTGLMLVVALVWDAKAILAVTLSGLLGFALLAAIQFPVARFLTFYGIQLAGVAMASVFLGTEPVFSSVLARIFLGEPIAFMAGVGILAVVLGIGLLLTSLQTGPEAAEASMQDPGTTMTAHSVQHAARRRLVLGIFVATLAAAAYGISRTMTRYLVIAAAPPQVAALYTTLFGTVYLSAMSGRKVRLLGNLSSADAVMVGAAGIFASLGSLFVFLALSKAPVILASPLFQLKSLVGIVLAHFFLKRLERVTPRLVVGACLVFGGVVMVIIG
jgi:drug/metabolite transporter (DMT)-like permease